VVVGCVYYLVLQTIFSDVPRARHGRVGSFLTSLALVMDVPPHKYGFSWYSVAMPARPPMPPCVSMCGRGLPAPGAHARQWVARAADGQNAMLRDESASCHACCNYGGCRLLMFVARHCWSPVEDEPRARCERQNAAEVCREKERQNERRNAASGKG